MKKGFENSSVIFLVFLGLISLFPSLIKAQGRNQEVTIVAPYQPTISDASKIDFKPVLKDTLQQIPPLDYTVLQVAPLPQTFTPEPISAVYTEIETADTLRRNYLRAGFGNYTTPYAELFTNTLKSDEFSLGFHAKHLSSSGQIDDYATSKFSQNRISLFGKRYLRDKTLSGNLFYKRDVVHYYGFKPDNYVGLDVTDEDLKQRFSLIGAEAGLVSNYKRNGNLNYSVKADFYNLTDLFEIHETKVGMGGNVNSKNEFMDFVDEQELGADGQLDYYRNSDSINSQGTTVFSVQPYIRLNFDELNIYVGLRGTLAADSTSEFHVYPAINLTYQVIPDYLQFYAGISGGLQRNSFRSVSDENPWINPVFPLGFSSTKYQFKGGFTGKIDMVLDYNFSVAYADVEDMLFCANIFSDPLSSAIPENLGNKFTGIYDDVQHTTVKAEFTWQQSYNLTVSLAAEYNDYKMADELKPWHKPAFNTKLGAKYQLNPRISLSGEIYYRAKVYAKLFESDPQMFSEVNSFADLSLGGEYQFNDRVSAFLKLNNLTGTQYYRWYNYPMQRFNAMAGLTFSF